MKGKEKVLQIHKKLQKIYPDPKIELNYSNPIELLIAVILSAQATDKQVNIVTKDLFKKYKSIDNYKKIDLIDFQKDISSIGLYKAKGKNILSAISIIDEKYNGKVPNNMDDLVKLPGIGRKTANVLLFNIYNINEGIAVDTHVKRLSGKFGLSKETNPDKIEKDLMKLVPQSKWGEFSARLVLYGRYLCKANCKHETCPLNSFIS